MTEGHGVNYLLKKKNVVTCMKIFLLQWTLSETGYTAATAALPPDRRGEPYRALLGLGGEHLRTWGQPRGLPVNTVARVTGKTGNLDRN